MMIEECKLSDASATKILPLLTGNLSLTQTMFDGIAPDTLNIARMKVIFICQKREKSGDTTSVGIKTNPL